MDYNKLREEVDNIIESLDSDGEFLCDDEDNFYIELDMEQLWRLLFNFCYDMLEKYK